MIRRDPSRRIWDPRRITTRRVVVFSVGLGVWVFVLRVARLVWSDSWTLGEALTSSDPWASALGMMAGGVLFHFLGLGRLLQRMVKDNPQPTAVDEISDTTVSSDSHHTRS